MLLRLLLVLLLAFVAPAPAMAANCAMPAMPQHAIPDTPVPHQSPDEVMPAHLCVGCVPLGDWLRAPVTAPTLPPALPPVATIARLDLSIAGSPALPPPRLG